MVEQASWQQAIYHTDTLIQALADERDLLLHATQLEALIHITETKQQAQFSIFQFIERLIECTSARYSPNTVVSWQMIETCIQTHYPNQINYLKQFKDKHATAKQAHNINEILLAQRMQDTQQRLNILLQQQEEHSTYTHAGKPTPLNTSRTSETA